MTQSPAISAFKPAVKTQAKLRLAVTGGPGTGKTFTALRIARGLADSRAAVIDTEAGSASKYADLFGFDTMVLTSYEPQDYITAIAAAEDAGYEVLVIDSLTHEWEAVKQDVDRRKSGERNQFAAWREPKKQHNLLIDKILQSRLHIIGTMRSKVEYALDNSSGRAEVKKLGAAPIQQDEMPFHFDVIGDLDQDHNMTISKSRIAALADKVIEKPGEELGKKLRAWLAEGEIAPTPRQHTALSDEARTRIDTLRLAAAAATEHRPYETAAAYLKGEGYAGWADFFKRGSNEDAAMLEQIFTPAAEPVPA